MDFIYYGTAFNAKIRFSAAITKNIVEEARRRHSLSPLTCAVLGRALTGAILASPWLAEKETFTIDILGNGPVKRVVAQSFSFKVRGYVGNPGLSLPLKESGKFDVGKAVGKGILRIIRDLGLRNPYVSQVPIKSGEIAEDLAYYFNVSEQLPTAMALGVLVGTEGVRTAGGFAIQILEKDVDEKIVNKLEKNVKKIKSITIFLLKHSPLDVLEEILGSDLVEYERKTIRFECNCTREKAYNALMVLSSGEIEDMIEEKKGEVVCKWCGKKYIFLENDLKKVLYEKQKNEHNKTW
ncbi:MAG TPA: Hsp33 family molecular chaperone HslO [Thermotoga sp.]|nr:Hsp33 family molecular chaperone HslO [Thermotoga sp.]